MKTRKRSWFLYGMVALALVISILATSVAAFAFQTVQSPDAISWHIDFDNMSSPTVSQIEGVTLQTAGFSLTETDSRTCLGRVNGNGHYYVQDDNCVISSFDTVSVEASIRFDAFPSGTDGSGNSPATYPMSLITWMTKSSTSASTVFRSFRVDGNGQLYTGTAASTATGVSLTQNAWNVIKLIFEPSTGAYSVYVNGEYGFSGNFGAPTQLISSIIRFFDTRYSYTAYVDDIHIRASESLYWDFDFDTGAAITSTDIEDVSVTSAAFAKTTYDSRSCIHVDGKGNFVILDENLALANCENVVVEADMNFVSFPSGTYSGKTSYEYPMSLFTWITGESGSTSRSYRSFRIDGGGQLYKGSNVTTDVTDSNIPQGVWTNVKLVFSPQGGGDYDLYLNDVYQFTSSFGSPANIGYSAIRIGDTTFHCNLYVDNIRVYSLEGYQVGVNQEPSADFVKSQQSAVSSDSFDMRLISAIGVSDYSEVGYRITEILGEQISVYDVPSADVAVSESLSAGNFQAVSSSEVGGLPILSCVLTDIDTTTATEFLVQPYVVKNGHRIYGASAVVRYDGTVTDGIPAVTQYTGATKSSVEVSEDTYVRGGLYADINYGEDTILVAKTDNPSYTRYTYLKFDISQMASDAFVKARICLPVKSCDGQNDTIAAAVYGIDPDAWEENTVTYNTRPADGSLIASFSYGKPMARVDVTDYVNAALEAGETEVSFKIQNTVSTVSETKFESSESGNGAKLELFCTSLEYETALCKYANRGYDPWGYAEELVAEWQPRYAAILAIGDHTAVAIDEEKSADDYSATLPLKRTPSVASYSNVSVRNVSTLENFTPSTHTLDAYGGLVNSGMNFTATGYFRTAFTNGRWWVIDPLGNPCVCIGMNTVNTGSTDAQKNVTLGIYNTEDAWAAATSSRLNQLGINMVYGGTWTKLIATETPNSAVHGIGFLSSYASKIGLNSSVGGSTVLAENHTMTEIDPEFVAYSERRAMSVAAPYSNNARILGWTSDNELPADSDMLMDYLTLDPSNAKTAFSYAVAWTWLKVMTGNNNPSLSDVTAELNAKFKGFVYDRYYAVVVPALRAADPNHMYLGCRALGNNFNHEEFLRVSGYWCDVITLNYYNGVEPQTEILTNIQKYAGKPFIITEFYAKGMDAVDMNGDPMTNVSGAGWVVQNQAGRGAFYQNFALKLIESKYCVGWTWYMYRDNDQGNPQSTDVSNLDSNKGIFDNNMNEYTTLTSAMSQINLNVYDLISYFDGR